MKQPKPPKASKHRKLPDADLGHLASAMHAAVALAHASGEALPRSLAQKFYALLDAELETVLPPAEISEEIPED